MHVQSRPRKGRKGTKLAEVTPTIPRAPAGLHKAGKALWRDIRAVFNFTEEPHLVAILEQACRVRDRLDELQTGMAGQPLIGPYGSAKQLTVHPLIAEIRFQQKTLTEHLRALGLPDNGDGESISDRNRRAARARWDNRS